MSGIISALAVGLALGGLLPFAAVALNTKTAVFSRHHVEVKSSLKVLYVYLVVGALMCALGTWVLLVQNAKANVVGIALVVAAAYLAETELRALADKLR